MSWWIFILGYLWQNSLRRWWESPLSWLSKLVVSGLLGVFGAITILGLKNLGEQLDVRLRDKEALAVIVSESFPREVAPLTLLSGEVSDLDWRGLGAKVDTILLAPAFAILDEQGYQVPVVAVQNMEKYGLVDDFFLLSQQRRSGMVQEFEVRKYRSEAFVAAPPAEIAKVYPGREVLLGSLDRLMDLLGGGFTKTTILQARSVEEVAKVHQIVEALTRVEGRRIMIQSNLRILQEIQKIRVIQANSLIWITVLSCVVLGLVFGSLAWMEFREERYLLALIRSFGVGRPTLLFHAVMENCLLAWVGVFLGLAGVDWVAHHVELDSMRLGWLQAGSLWDGRETMFMLISAVCGGMLACIPVAVGLRKPLGLVLK